MSVEVKLRRVPPENEHEAQKWYVLEGYVDGYPAVTKRDTINVAALASGAVTLADRCAKMRADVAEYYARFMALADLQDPNDL